MQAVNQQLKSQADRQSADRQASKKKISGHAG
jgi:hypothetical protein